MKEIGVILSQEAKEVYTKLNADSENSKQSRMLLKAINQKIDLIKQNIHYGDPIAKNLIPEEYRIKYGTINLFRVELPCFWRMLYTLTNNEQIEIIVFVLDLIDHSDYDKKFGYRRN
jgi:hypothetical protein